MLNRAMQEWPPDTLLTIEEVWDRIKKHQAPAGLVERVLSLLEQPQPQPQEPTSAKVIESSHADREHR
jgi:hypothetical protein